MEIENEIENEILNEMHKGVCVGIDLGTTNSCVAYHNKAQTIVCQNEFGNRTTPSFVSFEENEKTVGETACEKQTKNPKYTLFETKRFIGRTFDECQEEQKNYQYEMINLGDNKINFLVKYHKEDRIFCPEEIAAIILNKMTTIASEALDKFVESAVITVPAYFNDAQRQATYDAGKLANIKVLRIINEPTAAAIAYGLNKNNDKDINVLVFDLGGGTIDTSLLTISNDGIFEVLSIAGDTHLGGADFDQCLVSLVSQKYKDEFGKELKSNVRVKQVCETAKCKLSGASSTQIELIGIGPLKEDFEFKITRAQFEEICNDLFIRCEKLVKKTLQDGGISAENVDDVVLVGGSTRIPKIQKMLGKIFGKDKICKSINPDEAVAIGAAIQAAVLNGGDDVSDGVPDIILLDVCPLSLGVETTGGLMSVIIPRNSMVPIKKSKIYSTTEDNQTSVTIQVFEGERSATKNNRLLGSFELEGLQCLPRGTPKIRVSFELDADGIFTVSAKNETDVCLEKGETNKEQILTIQNNKGRLSDKEMKNLLISSKELEMQDALFREKTKLKNDFESLLFGVKRTFTENTHLKENTDKSDIQCVLDIVKEQLLWLENCENKEKEEELIAELQRRHNYLENEIARPMIDAANIFVQKKKL